MSPKNYKEQDFEEHIEEHLLNSGYHKRLPEDYDKDLCLIPDELIKFIKDTQSEEYAKLEQQYHENTQANLCSRIEKEIATRGTLHVLRKGIRDRGANIGLAYFKPSSAMNPEHQVRYSKNRLSIIRQLEYSKKNGNSLDLTICLNGLPVITAELKNSLTGQFVEEAVKQYKKDRDSKEPLFLFKRCVVHFAVGNEKVFMTTRLQNEQTCFLPFNKDTDNPINPNGHQTAYLWEDILQPDMLLDLLNNYLHIQHISEKCYEKDKGLVDKEYEISIFPRFHQLDCVKKILNAVRTEGVGYNYLIQHSAGSGKSNSIAWLAHQLASLYQHKTDKDRLFDSIVVVTDRKILDRQLQNTIKQFEQTTGVVNPINLNSEQLRKALQTGKSIIISTIQKFGVIGDEMSGLKGSRFAVIIDEAHSSATGQEARDLRKTLSVKAEDEDEEKVIDIEDEIEREIKARGRQPHISYFAFTATPKNKTLELFGRKKDESKFIAFHVYSMRQAIEENFILDVLKNYTTYKRYFKLLKTIEDDKEYDKKKASRLLTSFVDMQPHTLEMKTRIILEHFLAKTVNAIQGKGRAMVVTRSRIYAIKLYLMFKKIMGEKGLLFKPVVAFSGTVIDPDTAEEYTENSLNRLKSRVGIEDALKTPDFRILIVANKYQTGYDEPLLHTMYVDKKLDGVGAVQCLSRLNRTSSGKNEAVVLDFANEANDIQEAFQPYYQTSILTEGTDPNKLYDIQLELDGYDIFSKDDVERLAEIFYNPKEALEKLQPILDRVVTVWKQEPDEKREEFRSLLQSYVRLYGFISQLITFVDTDLEKLYVFAKALNRKLPRKKTVLPMEVQDAVDLDSFRLQQTFSGSKSLRKENGEVIPIKGGKHKRLKEDMDFLSHIIKILNETYGAELTEEDKVDLEHIQGKVEANEDLIAVMNPDNSPENIRIKFDEVVDSVLLEFVHTKLELYKKLTDPKVNDLFKKKWFEAIREQNHVAL